MATATATIPRFDFGRVFAETFDVAGKNFLTFAMLAAIATVPRTIFAWFSTGNNSFSPARLVTPNGTFAVEYFGLMIVSTVLAFVFSCILQAALIHGTVVTLNGQRASFIDCLKTGLSSFFAVVAIAFLMGLGFLAGLIFLIVPGIILMMGWFVAIPARIVERKPIFETFGRSWELTRGHRGAIFGIFIVSAIGSAIFQSFTLPFAGLATGSNGVGGVAIYVVVAAITQTLVEMFSATLAGVVYYELRSVKEGIGPETLASVFD